MPRQNKHENNDDLSDWEDISDNEDIDTDWEDEETEYVNNKKSKDCKYNRKDYDQNEEKLDKLAIINGKRNRTQTNFYHNEREKYTKGKYNGKYSDTYDREYNNRDEEIKKFVKKMGK